MTPQEWTEHLKVPAKTPVHLAALPPQTWAAVRNALVKHGFKVAELDGSAIADDAALFNEIAQAFRLPDYFGKNWDALDECLRDLSWLPAKGYVLFLQQADRLRQTAPDTLAKLVRSVLFVAEEWAKDSIPFHLVVASVRKLTAADLTAPARGICTH